MVPVKVRPANASTVKVALWPSRTRPTSASSIAASTCMSARFCAMMNSSGACNDAATVCPGSTDFLTTTPSTGARIAVRSRSILACASCASRCCTTAAEFFAFACATPSCAFTASSPASCALSVDSARSASEAAIKFFSTSDFLRSTSRFASARLASARATSARCTATLACCVPIEARAASRSAWAWRSLYSNCSGSMRATSWPFLTALLKSTKISFNWPDTCEPTDTDTTGLSVPVAETVAASGPCSTLPVRNWGAAASALPRV